jgi:hypothetical protein
MADYISDPVQSQAALCMGAAKGCTAESKVLSPCHMPIWQECHDEAKGSRPMASKAYCIAYPSGRMYMVSTQRNTTLENDSDITTGYFRQNPSFSTPRLLYQR